MSTDRENAEALVRRLAQEKGLYALEAYIFVFQALEHTFEQVGKRRHVSGAQLAEGFRQLAASQFGRLAPVVLSGWGVKGTDDIGIIVFHLVDAGLMGKTARDTAADFHALYDFATAFEDERPRPPLSRRTKTRRRRTR
ncbi:MAG: hypothetical protein HYY93_04030 [Planctomycetes bacterium]|nr:hypothetical protein [Planctomycetota bacterium]